MKKLILFSLVYVLTACQAASPTIRVAMNNEFTLERDQSATIRGTDLTITFSSVLSDDRCPMEVECAASGPVTVSLSVQRAGEIPSNITLETFTDQQGRSPGSEVEGIDNSADLGDQTIWLLGVVPYPKNLSGIKASDYQATLVVIQN